MSQYLGIIVLTVAVLGLAVRAYFKRVTIFELERGLKYDKGQFSKILRPGQYWISTYSTTVTTIDIRPKFLTVAGQEVLSADSISLKVSITAKYEVADPYIAINRIESYESALYIVLQLALRELVASLNIDALLKRCNLNQRLMELATAKVEELGLRLLAFDIKAVMFPGNLKNVFAQVAIAQKEGLAALEKARGETAALRNLANAARLLDNNPNLMQLRFLQSLDASSGNTFVLGLPSPTPVPITVPSSPTTASPGE